VDIPSLAVGVAVIRQWHVGSGSVLVSLPAGLLFIMTHQQIVVVRLQFKCDQANLYRICNSGDCALGLVAKQGHSYMLETSTDGCHSLVLRSASLLTPITLKYSSSTADSLSST
jgi:hypothetical protein